MWIHFLARKWCISSPSDRLRLNQQQLAERVQRRSRMAALAGAITRGKKVLRRCGIHTKLG